MSQTENVQKTKAFENEILTLIDEHGTSNVLVEFGMRIRAMADSLILLEERIETVEKQLKVSNFAHNIIKEIEESYR
jgi:hypothetical protein